MLSCPPQCPTLRRQIREEVKKSGWTDEYMRNIIDVQRVDIAEDWDRKVKPDPRTIIRRIPLGPPTRVTEEPTVEHDDRYKEKPTRKDYPDKIVQNSIRITDFKEVIDKDEIPLASLKQETIYYTEEKEIARVAPLVKRISPEVSRPGIPKERRIERPIVDRTYDEGRLDDTAAIQYRADTGAIQYRTDTGAIQYRADIEAIDDGESPRIPPDSKRIVKDQERRKIKNVDDKTKIKRRDDSPDSYYKYTPKELPTDWPQDEHAEKLLQKKKKDDRYLATGLSYFDDVCTCSLSCMIHNLKKDRFVRSILASAILFSLGIKLCSELYGWYLPNRT
ncbi:calponin homology domain-containing protein -like [Vespula squamosa]|uniref:Calponin homology domain-containing protein -like n=1 Tax=Vespula squamosa TaxID=30214 RepID=A0ABD2AV39_VESSQ